ncbi:cytosolic protein [Bacillus sp. BGMRC 2118]|nr:cytosolic protein [Bacillus sp. BGMRC 2118]
MKLVDELYEMYKHHFTGDEEDIDIIAFSVLEQLNRKTMFNLLSELDDQELLDLVGLYLIEGLKGKLAKEGLLPLGEDGVEKRTIH